MNEAEIIEFYESRGFKVINKSSKLEINIHNEIFIFLRAFYSYVTIKDLEFSLTKTKKVNEK